uniref:hypothetical protein n=1 Tax=Flavobacterium sp. TaxID=239 RepID=UPI004047999E
FQVGGNTTCCGETRMSINGVSGNVGIGTIEPSGKLDINLGGWGNIPRVVFKSVSDNPGMNFYRPTGTGTTAYPWRIEGNLGALEFQTGDPANIGSETFVKKFYIDNSKAFFTDNVGIGTENPVAKLHVSSTVIPESSTAPVDDNLVIEAKSTEKAIDKGATLGFVIPSNTDGGNLWQQGRILVASDKMDNYNADGRMYIQTRFFNYANNTWDWNNNLVLRASGNVGIGTEDPTAKLQVQGDIKAVGDINSYRSNNDTGGKIGFETYDTFLINSQKVAHYGMSKYSNQSSFPMIALSGYFGTTFHTVGTERMRIAENGNVGIGTANPDSKLTVKGSIHAEEVKVDLAIAPDYVFEKYYDGYSTLKSDYKMPTLQEVEAYTKENKHLPEVPSAQEIKENGLKLGEMNAILLQKIEELTLYLIEQNKEIEKLKTKVDELSKK